MGQITNFRDLRVWEKSHLLTLEVYKLTHRFPRFEEYGLSSQMRRSAASAPTNIAEGFKRKSSKDSCHFYNLAESSIEELKYQLILARDLGYITFEQYNEVNSLAEEVSKMLSGWIKSQSK